MGLSLIAGYLAVKSRRDPKRVTVDGPRGLYETVDYSASDIGAARMFQRYSNPCLESDK